MTNSPQPVKIPASLVPRAAFDYEAEAQQILGHDLILSDGLHVPPLTAARLIALELVTSRFYMDPFGCEPMDAAAALVICTCRRAVLESILDQHLFSHGTADGAGGALRTLAASFLMAHADAMRRDYSRLVAWIRLVPLYGFDMRPKHPAPTREMIFDGEFVGSVLAPAAKLLATPLEMILWDTPLCVIGHAIAQQDAALGTKGVERPPDTSVLDRMTSEAEAREAAGELHPWQYIDPVNYPLTETQAQANPELIPVFDAILQEFLASGGKPVDPSKYPVTPPAAPSASETVNVSTSIQDLYLYV
jgi:hypothetical protein